MTARPAAYRRRTSAAGPRGSGVYDPERSQPPQVGEPGGQNGPRNSSGHPRSVPDTAFGDPPPRRPAVDPPAYRPSSLFDEVGKMFERIIVSRLFEHLSLVGPDLDDCLIGFRRGHSTLDAICCVRSLAGSAVARGRVELATSRDIVNTFNSLA